MRKLKLRTVSIFVVLCIFMQITVSHITVSAFTSEGFDGGNGTASNPWQISTLAQLQLVRNHLSGHFILTQNITLTGTWQPIGYNSATASNMFTGSFDGNGKTISGLYAVGNYTSKTSTTLSASKVGFFGSVRGATIKNLTLAGTSVSGSIHVGSLIGYSYGDLTVDNCHSSVNVSATGAGSGGLIGEAADGTGWDYNGARISNCSYTGVIVGKGQTGGIVGLAKRAFSSESKPMITRCRTTGNVSGSTEVGGIAGEAYGVITQCYSTGNVTGSSTNVGGIVGSMMASGNTSSQTAVDYGTYIYDSYSLGNIIGSSGVGGIGGYSYETSTSPSSGVARCYAAGMIEATSTTGYTGVVLLVDLVIRTMEL